MCFFEFTLQALGAGDLGEKFQERRVILWNLQKDLAKSYLRMVRLGIIP
jgi:hypothetical protein